MSYAIIRNEKYKRENLKGIFRHNERRNKNYDLVATKDVNLTYDAPKFISMKRILPPQNYRYNNV